MDELEPQLMREQQCAESSASDPLDLDLQTHRDRSL
jgi:hypothetical protein